MPESFSGQVNAPEFPDNAEWINVTLPITLRELRGKLVILDFWTYCWINCLHIFPQLEKIQEKYDQELVVIGIHSAKFPNERSKENLYNAVRRYELTHPVINDPQFQIWRQYACRAWPTLMFVNPKGKVVGKHEGEITHEALDLVVSRLINQFDNDKTIDRSPTSFNPVSYTHLTLPTKRIV